MIDLLNIPTDENQEFLVLSDIHEHPKHFYKMLDTFPLFEQRKLIVCGDIIDKGFGFSAFEEIAQKIMELHGQNLCYFIKGNHELKHCKKNGKAEVKNPYLSWIDKQPIALSFVYPNKRYTFVHAGIGPKTTWDNLHKDLNVCYMRGVDKNGNFVPQQLVNGEWMPRDLDSTFWHEIYDGRFGFVIAGHIHQEDGIPKVYKHSMNIDTACFKTKKLTAALVTSKKVTIHQVEI